VGPSAWGNLSRARGWAGVGENGSLSAPNRGEETKTGIEQEPIRFRKTRKKEIKNIDIFGLPRKGNSALAETGKRASSRVNWGHSQRK